MNKKQIKSNGKLSLLQVYWSQQMCPYSRVNQHNRETTPRGAAFWENRGTFPDYPRQNRQIWIKILTNLQIKNQKGISRVIS